MAQANENFNFQRADAAARGQDRGCRTASAGLGDVPTICCQRALLGGRA